MLDRFNNLPAVKLLGQGAPGVSSGQAIAEVERIAREVLPPDFSFDWGGASYQEKRSSGTSGLALVLGALMVFLILSAQYEKWSLPLSVLLALPFGTFGALAAVWLRGMTNDVYFQIGLVTLLGLAAKNAILIVEYASLKRHEGMSASAAALEAARLRFRPIIMTSLAFILGVLPLAFSSGAGAGARRSVGTGVMGGMLAATFLAIFFVPMFFRIITARRLREPRSTEEIAGRGASTRHADRSPPGRDAPSAPRTAPAGPRCPAWTESRHEAAPHHDRAPSRSRSLCWPAAPCRRPSATRRRSSSCPRPRRRCPTCRPNGGRASTTPRLDALVAEALANNRDLARAMARIDESRAAAALARRPTNCPGSTPTCRPAGSASARTRR